MSEIVAGRVPSSLLLTGPRASGKTTLAIGLAEASSRRSPGARPAAGGIVTCCERMADGRPRALWARDLASGEVRLLAARGEAVPGCEPPRLSFSHDTFSWAIGAFRAAALARPGLLVLDEIGPLEFAGEGWSPLFTDLSRLMETGESALLITVREGLVPALLGLLPSGLASVLTVDPATQQETAGQLAAWLGDFPARGLAR